LILEVVVLAKYIMALDAGTTSNRCILFDKQGSIRSMAQKGLTQFFPEPGWVEHDANEIWQSQLSVAREALVRIDANACDIAAIGITNQRETTVVWDRETGQPICHAIVWQCRRTTELVDKFRAEYPRIEEKVHNSTGLIFDPYFSATKIRWILDNVEGARKHAEQGKLCFGTVDSWLIYKLTKGSIHVTDYSNASRTLLFNINTLQWDEELCSIFRIPMSMLPEVKPSSCVYGESNPEFFGTAIPIASAAGDQQSALFGQTCFEPGEVKSTYGTGCFMLMNTGNEPIYSKNGLISTIAWGLDDKITYALEGSVYMAGAVIQWLRDGLRVIDSVEDSEYFATRVNDTDGVYIVPAFTGLGAPYWDPYARGSITGITRGTNKCHIIRAALESIAFQTNDVLHAMELDLNVPVKSLKVDGGACKNNFIMQFQANIINAPVKRPSNVETTAMGAAFLAGLAVGFWNCKDEILNNWILEHEFKPQTTENWRHFEISHWAKAVKSTRNWVKE
jgi:glycerol kinase